MTVNCFLEFRPRLRRRIASRSLPKHFKFFGAVVAAEPADDAARDACAEIASEACEDSGCRGASEAPQRRSPGKVKAKQKAAAAAREEERLLREAAEEAAQEAARGVAPPTEAPRAAVLRNARRLGHLTTRERLRATAHIRNLALAIATEAACGSVTNLVLPSCRSVFFVGADEEATDGLLRTMTNDSWHKAATLPDGRRVGQGHCGMEGFALTWLPPLATDTDALKATAALAKEPAGSKVVFVVARWAPWPPPTLLLLRTLGTLRRWRHRVLIVAVSPSEDSPERVRQSLDDGAAACDAPLPVLRWWHDESLDDVVEWILKR